MLHHRTLYPSSVVRALFVLFILLPLSLTAAQNRRDDDGFDPPRRLEDYEDRDTVLEQLEDAGLEFEDGEYLVENEDIRFNGAEISGEELEPFGDAKNIVMSATLVLTDSGACGIYAYRDMDGSDYRGSMWLYIEPNELSFGSQEGSDLGFEKIESNKPMENLLNNAHHLIVVIVDDRIWVYLDGELQFDGIPLVGEDGGEFGVYADLNNANADCEISDYFAYTWE
jgi:hypothetical protein